MQQIGLKALGILLVSITLASCDLNSSKDPVIVAEVNNEFHIDLWENLSPFEHRLLFKIQSIAEYDCENYTIDFNVVKKFRKFSISLNDIQEPNDCEEGLNTAHASIDLGALSPGFYKLDLNLKNSVFNSGQLTVSSERYLVEMEDDKGIIFVQQELFRMPDNTIWGYISYSDTANEIIANDFIEQLEGITQTKSLSKGYYGYFSIDTNNSDQVKLTNPPITDSFKAFLFHFEGLENEIGDLVDQFREDHGQFIQIELTNDQGKVF